MKRLSALLILPFLLMPMEASAQHRHNNVSSRGRVCYKEVWREEYVPGNRHRRGYVRRWKDVKRIRCRRPNNYRPPVRYNNNTCMEGAIIGGILGGGIGASASSHDALHWAIPLGVVTGGIIGCQLDNG